MSPSRNKPTGLIADADVLIDYADSMKSVLKLISQHIAPIHVPSLVFQEVSQLSDEDVASLCINVIEPTLDQVLEAQAGQGSTSFQDRLCFVTARDMGCFVLTNDVALRKACKNDGIGCLWGMEAMVILVERNQLSPKRAIATAEQIAHINPYIAGRVLKGFRDKIDPFLQAH